MVSSWGPGALSEDDGMTSSERSITPGNVEAFRWFARWHRWLRGLKSLRRKDESFDGSFWLAIAFEALDKCDLRIRQVEVEHFVLT